MIFSKKAPKKVRIFEVGPRDGLQNESQVISFEKKLEYIEKLIAAGLQDIEVGAFVREDRIPQMAQTDLIFKALKEKGYLDRKNLNLWALVPNERGLERALLVGCKAVAVFTGATDTFTQKNIGMNVQDSLKVFQKMASHAKKQKLKLRGYVSVCWGCPYEGTVAPKKVVQLAHELLDMGVSEVSLGDTIGVATPIQVKAVLSLLNRDLKKIATHFHDTRGTAIANCLTAIGMGIHTIDASSAGLGGCNYAPGASGNVATEDVVYMLTGMGIKTGVNLDKLCEASQVVIQALNRFPASKYYQAHMAKKTPAKVTLRR